MITSDSVTKFMGEIRDISYNQISTLPMEISNITSLANFFISNNLINTVPRELCSISPLVNLDLSNNTLTSLPPCFGNLSLPEGSLNISHNQLASLPPNFNNLATKYLDISFNKLNKLPNITKMNSISRLFASNNNLTSISDLGNRLEYLDLSYNQISSLPANLFSGWLQLSELILTGNLLTTLPDLNDVDNLVQLLVSKNKLKALPDEIVTCAYLTTIDASNNYISELPLNFGSSPRLTSLNLQHNLMSGNVSVLLAGLALEECDVSYNTPNLICPSFFKVCCSNYTPPSGTSATTVSSSASTSAVCTGYACVCSSDLDAISTGLSCVGGIWNVNGDAINNDTVVVGQPDTIVIGGSFIQTEQATLQVYLNSSTSGNIQIQNTAQLGGVLVIIVTGSLANQTSQQLINAANITGMFNSVQIIQKFPNSECYQTEAKAVYTSTSMGALLTQTRKPNCKSDNRIRTIAIAVGVSVGGVVFILIIAIIILIILKQKIGGNSWRFGLRTSPDDARKRDFDSRVDVLSN